MAVPDYSELDRAIAKQGAISPLMRVLQSLRTDIGSLKATQIQITKRIADIEAKISKWPAIK